MFRRSFRLEISLLAALLFLNANSGFTRSLDQASKDAEAARHCFETGDFDQSLDLWRSTITSFKHHQAQNQLIEADLGLAAVYQALGLTERIQKADGLNQLCGSPLPCVLRF